MNLHRPFAGGGASDIQGATTNDHPLATPETVAAYLNAMVAENVIPQD